MNISLLYNSSVLLDDVVESVEWSGDIHAAYRTLVVTLTNTIDGNSPAANFELGRELLFRSDGVEVFRGFIFATRTDQAGLTVLTAYDENVYLTKNVVSKRFVNVTAAQIVQTLCTEFDVQVGTIEDTGYVIPKLILEDATLWDVFITALTLTYKQTGRRYYIYASGGALNLVSRNARLATYALESTSNLTAANYAQSIEDLRNQVRAVAGDLTDPAKPPKSVLVRDDDSIARYGLMQHIERADTDATDAQLQQLAQERLAELNVITDEATITCLGYDDTYAGTSVYVYEPITRIMGAYYVTADVHEYSASGQHAMTLTLSATDDLPTLHYSPPPEPEVTAQNSGTNYVWESWF